MKPYETPDIQAKLDIIKSAVLKIVPDTETIYLFGSYANGTPHKDSDLDIYVIVPDSNVKPLKTIVAITSLIHKNRFNMAMDLIVKHSSKFHHNKNHATFEKIVSQTGVVIYG
jgi:predicted nucleotidyltransferase